MLCLVNNIVIYPMTLVIKKYRSTKTGISRGTVKVNNSLLDIILDNVRPKIVEMKKELKPYNKPKPRPILYSLFPVCKDRTQ